MGSLSLVFGTPIRRNTFQWLLPNSVVAAYEPTFPIFGQHLVRIFRRFKILTCLTTKNLSPYGYVLGENTTQTETIMSKIIAEEPSYFPKTSEKNTNTK